MPLKNKILKCLVSTNRRTEKARPIVGEPKCPSRKFRELIDALLKPFLKHVKSYIRDSIDFLNKCDRNTDGNTVISTFDVVSLDTNILHNFGMEAVRYFLLKYKEDIYPRFNIPFILESIDFILKITCVFGKYRVLIVIYFFHLFLYIKFRLRTLNHLLLNIYIYICIY